MIEVAKNSYFQANTEQYFAAQILPEHKNECLLITKKAVDAKLRYESVTLATGVPWFVIGAIHRRESDENWIACLHNGQKIIGTGEKTTIVPIGRGPFATWEEAAIDALKSSWHHYTWDLGSILEFCERFNGLGYRNHHAVSPYIYGFTTLYKGGQFNKDHKYDPNIWEHRIGIAAMLKCFEELGEIKLV